MDSMHGVRDMRGCGGGLSDCMMVMWRVVIRCRLSPTRSANHKATRVEVVKLGNGCVRLNLQREVK